MSRKQILYILFFSILITAFFFSLSMLIPEFTKPRIAAISNVQPFRFVDQDGREVNEEILKGRIAVVNYFFTTCRGICPRMAGNLLPVYREFSSHPDFLILSHTCDPGRDSVPVLRRYADSLGVDTNNWIFLTGDRDSLYAAARYSYRIDDPNNFISEESDFLHTQFMAVVNRKGDVVGIYDGIIPAEVQEMRKKILRLLNENDGN